MRGSVIVKLVLLVLLVALVLQDRSLDAEEASRRAVSSQVERLIPQEAKADAIIAAVTLKRGERELLYARMGGIWRCRDVYGAVADWQSLQGLVDMLLDAEGVMQTDVVERFGDYGIGTDRSWHVSFHGPGLLKQEDKDVFFELELGDPLPALGGCFVRVPGEDVVRVIERNPVEIVVPLGAHPDMTPLLDHHVVPRVWLPAGDHIAGVQVDRADGVSYGLQLRPRDLSPEFQAQGASPVEWVVVTPDGQERVSSPDHSIAYSVFLTLAKWVGVVDPARAEELGMGRAVGRVVLGANQAPPMVLVFGPTSGDDLVPMANDWAKTLTALPVDVSELFMPDPEALLDSTGPNPWEPWLIEASRAMLEQR